MEPKEILNAWVTSANPSSAQKKLAKERSKICDSCEFKGSILTIDYCTLCKCPISKKTYSNKYNPCPRGYWKDVDDNTNILPPIKRNKTII